MTNETIAAMLREHAVTLERDGANLFRARAFRAAAGAVRMLDRPVAEILQREGRRGLERLPGIGRSLGFTVEGLIRTGELRPLHESDPLRCQGAQRQPGLRLLPPEPAVADLLEVDETYRRRDREEDLPRAAPRFFHPERDHWVGVLNAERNGWRLRAVYANTALAHRLGKARDWVVIHFSQGEVSGQRTVATAIAGELTGARVVRGREAECAAHYQAEPAA